ncbi:hypothetical protein NFI95_05830 [Acetobacteraceae bacterium KSS8]|uniref:Single-stranded DNA-binding protein n=1 Tax=Endosaccharibacter trunci TaxID=2812733 RepID=A0ABT1W507_9PROT|nr:hypothetical protein [Acetobacteraceae bacterium KSS8]
MNDMSSVIVPKSDQINADDLIAGPRTVTITSVSIKPGTEQPVAISLEGDRKVYRPCKSMARVLVANWGADASQYVGRSMTLYRDPGVLWGGMAVGGIRISHMSHMARDAVMPLTEKKGSRKLFTVKVLQMAKAEVSAPASASTAPTSAIAQPSPAQSSLARKLVRALETAQSVGNIKAILEDPNFIRDRKSLSNDPTLTARINDAEQAATARFGSDAGQGAADLPIIAEIKACNDYQAFQAIEERATAEIDAADQGGDQATGDAINEAIQEAHARFAPALAGAA